MLDVLSILEGLSINSRLDQQEVSASIKSLSESAHMAFDNKDSKALRNSCSTKQLFSDGVASFSDGIDVFHYA